MTRIIEVGGKRYRIETHGAGRQFGTTARLTHLNGRAVAGFCGRTYPRGHHRAAADEAERWARKRLAAK
jgi:hypothetical protein